MGQVKSPGRYIFSLKIAKMQNNAKIGQKITILAFWKISFEILLGQKCLLGLFFFVKIIYNGWPRVIHLCLGTYSGGSISFKNLDFMKIKRNNYQKLKFKNIFSLLQFSTMYSHGY